MQKKEKKVFNLLKINLLKKGKKETTEKLLKEFSKYFNEIYKKSFKKVLKIFIENNLILFNLKRLKKFGNNIKEVPFFEVLLERLKKVLIYLVTLAISLALVYLDDYILMRF